MSRWGPQPDVQGTPGATVRVLVSLGDGYCQHTDAVLDAQGWHPLVLRWRGQDYVQKPDTDQHQVGVRQYQPAPHGQGVLW